MATYRTPALTDAEVALLATLKGEQLMRTGKPIALLDLAVKHFGEESDARQALQRLLVHGLIQLDEAAADVRRHCFGTVADAIGKQAETHQS